MEKFWIRLFVVLYAVESIASTVHKVYEPRQDPEAYITAVVALLPNAFCFLRRFRRTQEDTNSKAENSEHDDETTSLG
ncbi:hypothetical protein BGZ58_002173 [Dissophora ornata]|nr:hypothetical protein BGZ58_002173 [Dissophora ornata]